MLILKLKGSGHVQYLRNHPEDYLNQINIFTEYYCLKIHTKAP